MWEESGKRDVHPQWRIEKTLRHFSERNEIMGLLRIFDIPDLEFYAFTVKRGAAQPLGFFKGEGSVQDLS